MQVGTSDTQLCFIRLFSLGGFSHGNKRSAFVALNPELSTGSLVMPPNSNCTILTVTKPHVFLCQNTLLLHTLSSDFAQGFICK